MKFSPIVVDAIAGVATTWFTIRFSCEPSSLIRDMIESPAYQAPLSTLGSHGIARGFEIVPAAPGIAGTASTYDPTDANDRDAGNMETASGEAYDPEDWTAAIQIALRDQFGGVRYGRNYRPAFALVESGDKRAIVRINDVGPLRPGRIIDLNKRAMRYFDPTLERGLLDDVRVTPLEGQSLALGPVEPERRTTFASRFAF